MSLKVGIAGRRGTCFAPALHTHADAELVALCDIDAGRLQEDADKYEVPLRFTDFSEMLEAVDAVVVATPMQIHAAQSIEALNAGKHVLSEVTACVSLDECERLVHAARESSGMYMMSENYCYLKDNVLVREMARRGMFGDPYYGEGEYVHDVKFLHHNPDGSPTWRYYWQVGQNGNTYPTHSLGPVMQWIQAVDPADRVHSVSCMGSGRHTDPEHPHDDTTITLVKLRSGRLIRLRLDMMSNRPHLADFYSLQGTHGVYEASRIPGQPGMVWVGENPPPGPTPDVHREWRPLSDFEDLLPGEWRNPPKEALEAGHGGGDYFVIRDFIEAALGRRPNPIDVHTAVEWTAVGLCSQVSIQNGGAPVAMPSFH
ncbi:MAG TPA: Gfo/Idh/MocA family oxidoreductase [Fimbriimonas sp.]|nr:Gfo/Idh/MocA family oxidoreductase [Fimbriimonas sp.]